MALLDIENKLRFENLDLTAPITIIDKVLSEVRQSTREIVVPELKEYSGIIGNYTKTIRTKPATGLAAFSSALSGIYESDIQEVQVNIQDDLGKIGDTIYKYELFLRTPTFNQYKYRVCFVQFGIANYPVKLFLEQGVADEINKEGKNSDSEFECDSPIELQELLCDIFTTKKMIGIMQEIINIAKIHSVTNS